MMNHIFSLAGFVQWLSAFEECLQQGDLTTELLQIVHHRLDQLIAQVRLGRFYEQFEHLSVNVIRWGHGWHDGRADTQSDWPDRVQSAPI